VSSAALGIFGGTFDPIHVGHLRGAIDCRELLDLEQVHFLPAALPPLKATPGVSAEHRAAMVEIAIADLPGFSVDRREIDRPGVSYSIDTVREIRREAGVAKPLVFIMGLDSLKTLHRWRNWQDLLTVVNIAVLKRPGYTASVDPEVSRWLDAHSVSATQLLHHPEGGVAILEQPGLEVSSTAVRAAMGVGRMPRFLLPEPVLEYIERHGLYRPPSSSPRTNP
jgi:nicotinate-nucleotide adenylyltransferase